MAVPGLIGFAWLALFQLALALGAPIGQMAWGGAHAGRLPRGLRSASLAIAALGVLGMGVVAQRAGFIDPLLPGALIDPLLWGFCGLFAVSFLGNALSRSRVERLHGVPLTIVLCASTGWLAMT